MLGPDAGVNTVEVRSVDPTTGAKHTFATFTAWGIVPGPEVCNGLDDDQNGTPDDGLGPYCLQGGTAAANTDGDAACLAGFVDLNTDPMDGCEVSLSGSWQLEPLYVFACEAAIPSAFGPIVLDAVHLSLDSGPNTVTLALQLGAYGVVQVDLPVFYDPIPGILGGSGAVSTSTTDLQVHMQMQYEWESMFTDPGSFIGKYNFPIINLTVDMAGQFDFSGQCLYNRIEEVIGRLQP